MLPQVSLTSCCGSKADFRRGYPIVGYGHLSARCLLVRYLNARPYACVPKMQTANVAEAFVIVAIIAGSLLKAGLDLAGGVGYPGEPYLEQQ